MKGMPRFPKKGKYFPCRHWRSTLYYSWMLCLCITKTNPFVWWMYYIFWPQNVWCNWHSNKNYYLVKEVSTKIHDSFYELKAFWHFQILLMVIGKYCKLYTPCFCLNLCQKKIFVDKTKLIEKRGEVLWRRIHILS